MKHAKALLLSCLIAVGCTVCNVGLGQDATESEQAPAVRRLIHDLSLSESQAVVIARAFDELQRKFESIEEETAAANRERLRSMSLKAYPELDESVDINDRPLAEQAKIERDREKFAQTGGSITFFGRSREAALQWNAGQHETRVNEIDRTTNERREFIERLAETLSDSQLPGIELASARFEVTLDDPRIDGIDRDPVSTVDMLGLLEDAAAAELAPIAEPILDPHAVLHREGDPHAALASTVRLLTIAYASVLEAKRTQQIHVSHEYWYRFNRLELDEALPLHKRLQRFDAEVWEIRLRFVDEIASAAQLLIGDEARQLWLDRAFERFCPHVYLEDSVDYVVSRLRDRDDLSADAVAVVDSSYQEYVGWRNANRPRFARLTIAAVRTKSPHFADTQDAPGERLERATFERFEKATKAVERISAALPEDLRGQVLGWVEAIRSERSPIRP